MQTHAVILLYPKDTLSPEPAAPVLRRRRKSLETLAAIVDLGVTAAIGLGVLVCFGLVFTML